MDNNNTSNFLTKTKLLIATIVLLIIIGIILSICYKKNLWPYSDKKTNKENDDLASKISIILGILLLISGMYLVYLEL